MPGHQRLMATHWIHDHPGTDSVVTCRIYISPHPESFHNGAISSKRSTTGSSKCLHRHQWVRAQHRTVRLGGLTEEAHESYNKGWEENVDGNNEKKMRKQASMKSINHHIPNSDDFEKRTPNKTHSVAIKADRPLKDQNTRKQMTIPHPSKQKPIQLRKPRPTETDSSRSMRTSAHSGEKARTWIRLQHSRERRQVRMSEPRILD